MVLSTVGFGLLSFIKRDEDNLFFGLAIALRFFQGFGDSFVTVAALSIISYEFPTKREQFIGYAQSAVGIGFMAGPVLGSVIFSNLGYQKTFYVFGGILFACLLLIALVLPKRLNHIRV